jgi:hypothetical protein
LEVADQLERALREYIAAGVFLSDNLPPWQDDHGNYQRIMGRSKILKPEYIQRITKNSQIRYDNSLVNQRLRNQRLALRDDRLEIKREALTFELEHLAFHREELGMPALIAWLEVNGCQDIDYSYVVNRSRPTG